MKYENRASIKLFMGKGDYADQLPLALKRERQGWIMAESPDGLNYQRIKKEFSGATVVIHGAGAGACVAFAAEDALTENAEMVVVDFDYVKTLNEGADPIQTRARHFFEQLPSRFAKDKRLVIKPRGILKCVMGT